MLVQLAFPAIPGKNVGEIVIDVSGLLIDIDFFDRSSGSAGEQRIEIDSLV